MIIKTNNYYIPLYTHEGLQAWIKTADNKDTFNTIDTVVTELIITKEGSKEVLCKFTSTLYLCYYNNTKYFSIVDVIEDILYYLANNSYSTAHKQEIIYNVLNNDMLTLLNIKRANKQYKQELKDNEIRERNNKLNEQINTIKNDIDSTIAEINKYTKIRYNKANRNNNYTHTIITSNTIKTFNFGANLSEELKGYNDILTHLKEYLYYISIDFDPTNFLKFDKVI